MPNNSTLSTQQFANSHPAAPVAKSIRRTALALKARAGTRFARIAGMSFAATLPALGIVDPQVLLASGLSDVHTVELLVSRADDALRNMALLELFATGCVAVLALAAMAGAGYLRTRYMAASQEQVAAE